jgi:hypothetical protein
MGILPVDEWRWKGEGIGPAMKGTGGDYSSTTVAHSRRGQDELGERMDAAWTGGARRTFL